MKHTVIALLFSMAATALSPAPSAAQSAPVPPKSERADRLKFLGDIMATMPDDPRLYVLLGSGFLRPFAFRGSATFVETWLKSHPNAVVTPISRMIATNTNSRLPFEIVYVWLEDGRDSLNVDLVRNGIFAGGTMFDMVDNKNAFDRMLKNDSRTRALIEKERASAPQDRTDRLIPDNEYRQRMVRIFDAERSARVGKLGIWSDAMKAEREVEGIR